MTASLRPFVAAALLAAAFASCQSRGKTASVSVLPRGLAGSPGRPPAEADVRGRDLAHAPALRPVRFDLDSYTLSAESLERLGAHADHIRRQPGWEILVEGHCDDQGTDAYNLSLGQRRAKAVRDHLVRSGIPGNRLATVSYGEEKPFCRDETEACRARNRRAELRVISGLAKDGPTGR